LRISPRSIEEVREAANIVEVASEFTALKRQGTNYTGLCPYHDEKTPSFSVSPEKNFYYCFGCQKGGDAIKMVMELKSFSFAEAVSHLGERFGIDLKFEGSSPKEGETVRRRISTRRSAYKSLAAASAYYHKYLLKSPAAEEARQYLKGRGFEHSTIEEFRLGYAPLHGGFASAARGVGLDREALEAAGLLSGKGRERFWDRVMFPISDRRGRIVGFGARALRGDVKPKYLNSPETELFNKRALLYGFPQVAEGIRKEGSALVVEGYTDVLMLYQKGIKNVVATLGTAMTEQHLKALSGLADTIHLLFDPDDAGEKVLEKAFIPATEMKLDLRVVRLSEDPADWLLKHPAEEFRGLLGGATSVLEYVIRQITDRYRGAGAARRARALPEIKGLLRRIEDPVLKREALRRAAEALGVNQEDLHEESGSPIGRRSPGAPSRRAPSDPNSEAEREVLALMLARTGLATKVLSEGVAVPGPSSKPVVLEAREFGDEGRARIFELLVEHAGDVGAVLSDERARTLLDEISALQAAGERLYPSRASLQAAWLRLRLLNRQRAKQALQSRQDMDDESWIRLHRQLNDETRNLWSAIAHVQSEDGPGS
jgi:DNA primase